MRAASCLATLLAVGLSFSPPATRGLTEGGKAAGGAGANRPAAGPLRVHPQNPRYFTDGTKNPDGSLRAVYLTGAHT